MQEPNVVLHLIVLRNLGARPWASSAKFTSSPRSTNHSSAAPTGIMPIALFLKLGSHFSRFKRFVAEVILESARVFEGPPLLGPARFRHEALLIFASGGPMSVHKLALLKCLPNGDWTNDTIDIWLP